MCRQKPQRIQQRILLRRKRRRAFLSKAGPQVVRCVSQAGHHSSRAFVLVSDTRKATLSGRPRSSGHTAKRLARMPPGEGRRGTGPAIVRRLAPERHRRGDGRVDKDHRVGVVRHRDVQLRANVRCTQVPLRSSNELRTHDARECNVQFASTRGRATIARRWFRGPSIHRFGHDAARGHRAKRNGRRKRGADRR